MDTSVALFTIQCGMNSLKFYKNTEVNHITIFLLSIALDFDTKMDFTCLMYSEATFHSSLMATFCNCMI